MPTQHTAVPAYWAPDTESGAGLFRRLAQHRPTTEIVVVNGRRSGPQVPFDPAWERAISELHDAGAMVLGYVNTGYFGVAFPPAEPHATRPDGPGGGGTSVAAWTAQITYDIDQWHSLYGVDGVFLDQTIASCGTPDEPNRYADLYAGIRAYAPDDHIVINPGVPVEQCFDEVADTIVTFENSYAVYTDPSHRLNQTPAWQLDHPDPKKFWHLVYGAPSEPDMRTAVAESKRRNAGYVYVTDTTWDALPSYWDAELAAAAGGPDTTPPSQPTGVTGVARSGTGSAYATLEWGRATDDVAVTGYEVAGGPVSVTAVSNGVTVHGLAPGTAYTFTIRARDASGNVGPWSEPFTLTTPPPASAPIVDVTAYRTSTEAHYQATYVDPFTHHRVFIDADGDPTTGFTLPPGQPAGVEHMIENAVLYRYTGTGGSWDWVPVPGVAPLVSSTGGRYVWRVPVSAFGGNAARQVLVFQAAPPDVYSETLTIGTESGRCPRFR
jgi:chitodextrinase